MRRSGEKFFFVSQSHSLAHSSLSGGRNDMNYSVFGRGHRGDGKRPVFWQELWRHELHEAAGRRPVVIVPCGSVEQHGAHCPLDVDIVDALALSATVAASIDEFPVIVAPPIWSGLAHYKMGHIGTISPPVRDIRRCCFGRLPLNSRQRVRADRAAQWSRWKSRHQSGDLHQIEPG